MNHGSTYQRFVRLTAVAAIAAATFGSAHAATSLRVMSYNILVGGAAYGPLSRTVGVINSSQADVIGIQEVGGSAQAIASSLGFYYHGFNSDLAIVSRYPITQVLNQGVKLQVSPTQDAYLFDVHLAAFPYQPYDIRDGSITTEAQAIAAAQASRTITPVLNGMSSALASNSPVFLVGDFNEPSHLDWTQEAAAAGKHFGMKVNWPTSNAVYNAGMKDGFRELRPDEIADPADTWTPGYPAPNLDVDEVHDRIDFVYYKGPNITPLQAKTIGFDPNDGSTDIAIQPYPSDHRAVIVEFDTQACIGQGDLNGDCAVDPADWDQFRDGQHTSMTGMTFGQAMSHGDLNADLRNDYTDFQLFKRYYDVANGGGAFVAMLAATVPEPASIALASWAGFIIVVVGRRRRLG